MWKEIISCIVILVAIFVGNYITQNYTVQSVESLTSRLEELRIELINNQDNIEMRKNRKQSKRIKRRLGK